jgi:aminomethyltransferase
MTAGSPARALEVYAGETPVGEVLSGTHSPTLNKPIGTALVAAGYTGSAELTVDIRGNRIPLRHRGRALREVKG